MLIRIILYSIIFLASLCQDEGTDITLSHNQEYQDKQLEQNIDEQIPQNTEEADQIMLQAEQLLQDENPIIEQMLMLANGLGDDGDDTKMLLLLDDAKDQVSDVLDQNFQSEEDHQIVDLQIDYLINQDDEASLIYTNTQQTDHDFQKFNNTPEYAVLQSPQSESKIVENPKDQEISLRFSTEDEIDEPARDSMIQNWTISCEFMIGAILVFFSITMLWQIEARLFRRDLIGSAMEEFLRKNLIQKFKGNVQTQEYITDNFSGLKVLNSLRVYRKVEKLQKQGTWLEVKEPNLHEDTPCSLKINSSTLEIDGFILDDNLIQQMNNWEPLLFNQRKNDFTREFEYNDGRYLYINKLLRLSYFIIPCSNFTVISGVQNKQLRPFIIHVPNYDYEDIEYDNNCQHFGDEICQSVRQWIEWGEWDENQDQISIIQEGNQQIRQMVQSQLHKLNFNPKISRAIVFTVLCLGVQLFFLPIFQVLKLFPIFGGLVDYIGAWIGTIVGVLFATVSCLTTTGISYSLYKPQRGFLLISMALVICLVLIACTHMNYQINAKQIFQDLE